MKLIPILLCLSFCFTVFSQQKTTLNQYKEKYKNELAVYLNHNQILNIGYDKKTGELDIYQTVEEEVLYLDPASKIYTQNSIYLSDFFQDLISIEATIYNAQGKKRILKPTDFKIADAAPSSWVFHDDDKEILYDYKEVNEGYRAVVKYTKKLKKPEFIGIYQFTNFFPTLNQTFKVIYPADMSIKYLEMNLDRFELVKKSETIKGKRTDEWIFSNVEAYKIEKGSLGIRHYRPQVVVRIEKYKKNGQEVELMSNLTNLHDFFTELLLAKGNDKDKGELNRTVREITEGMEDDLEKMDTIFSWVQKNIKYIAFEDGMNAFVPRTCSVVMKNRYGDCKDMGNLLTEMLHYAGIKSAHLAWVGTRDIPYLMSDLPSPLTCNHVICVVEKPDGTYYYLDATSAEGSYLYPPSGIQGKDMMVHHGKKDFRLVRIPMVSSNENVLTTTIHYKLTDLDSIYGKGSDVYTGNRREEITYFLNNYDDEKLENYIKDICLNGFTKYHLKDYKIKNQENNNVPLMFEYNFSFKNNIIKNGDEYYFNPDLFGMGGVKYNKIEHSQTRKRDYTKRTVYEFYIEISDDFEWVHIPENIDYKHELFSYSVTYVKEGNKLIIKKDREFNLLEIPPSLYNDWNQYSDIINSSRMQNVVLKKK